MGQFVYQDSYVDSTQTTNWVSNSGQPVSEGIPAWYCATQTGAAMLQTWLKSVGIQVTISMDWPLYPQGSGNRINQSAKVPYLDDGNGAHENAGGLIWNFKILPYNMAAKLAEICWALDDTQPVG